MRRPSLLLLTTSFLAAAFAPRARAASVTADGAVIGSPGNPSWGGFWRTGLDTSDPWGLYSLLTNGANTYLNAPSSSGTIFFRGQNSGNTNPVSDPDGWTSRMYLDSKSDLHVGGSIYALGRADPTGVNDTFPGIFASSRDTTAGVGVRGVAPLAGLWGATTTATGFGVVGTSSGPGFGGLFGSDTEDVYNNGLWAQGTVVAGRFDGLVQIRTFSQDGQTHPGDLTVAGTASKPGGGMWSILSDGRVKRDVVDFTQGLADLEKVHVVRFKYNGLGGTEDTGKEYVGVVAQELEKVFPFMVSTQPAKLHPGDRKTTDIEQVDPSAFTFLLVNAVTELSGQNKRLAAEVAALTAQVEHDRKLVALIERRLGARTLAMARAR